MKTAPMNAKSFKKQLSNLPEGYVSLKGGLPIKDGEGTFTVVDDEKAFGIRFVEGRTGKWALPIVAGTLKVGDQKVKCEVSDDAKANLAVIADRFILSMQPGQTYPVVVKDGRISKVEFEKVAAGIEDEDED